MLDKDKNLDINDNEPVLGEVVEFVVPAVPLFSQFGRHDAVQPAARRPQGAIRTVNSVEVAPDTPLAYLLDLMDTPAPADYSPEQRLYHDRMRLEAAKAALPAVHARLAQVELGGRVTLTHEQALEALERGPVSGD